MLAKENSSGKRPRRDFCNPKNSIRLALNKAIVTELGCPGRKAHLGGRVCYAAGLSGAGSDSVPEERRKVSCCTFLSGLQIDSCASEGKRRLYVVERHKVVNANQSVRE